MQAGRRRFARQAAAVLLGGASVWVGACGEGNQPVAAEVSSDRVGQVANNHGHEAIVTAVELTRGGGLRLDLRGRSSHTHTLDLSPQDVERIRAGQRVTRLSSADYEDKHDHEVTFN